MGVLELQLRDYRPTTAEILYHFPDYPRLLQSFIWQEYDLAPGYPVLRKLLDFWKARSKAGCIRSWSPPSLCSSRPEFAGWTPVSNSIDPAAGFAGAGRREAALPFPGFPSRSLCPPLAIDRFAVEDLHRLAGKRERAPRRSEESQAGGCPRPAPVLTFIEGCYI